MVEVVSDQISNGEAGSGKESQRAIVFDYSRIGWRECGTGFRPDTEATGEGFLAGVEPFIEHTGMEQRSRES
jgi:hypothetical protein